MAQRRRHSEAATGLPSGYMEWLSVPEPSRALIIRNRFDEQWIHLAQQHERILHYCRQVTEHGLLNVSGPVQVMGLRDAECFIGALHRMRRLCELVRRSGIRHGALRQPINVFLRQVEPVTSLRNMQEHIDGSTVDGHDGIGYGVMPDTLLIAYGASHLDTRKLLDAASAVHRAVRAVVDPVAAADPHYHAPFVGL